MAPTGHYSQYMKKRPANLKSTTAKAAVGGSTTTSRPVVHDGDHSTRGTVEECDHDAGSREVPSKPLKKRRLRLDEGIESNKQDDDGMTTKETHLMRQVASCWLDHPDHDHCATCASSRIATTTHTPPHTLDLQPHDWSKVVTTSPPTSGSYLYDEHYGDVTKTLSLVENSPSEAVLTRLNHGEGTASRRTTDAASENPVRPEDAIPIKRDKDVTTISIDGEGEDEDSEREVETLTMKAFSGCGGTTAGANTEDERNKKNVTANSVTPSPYPTSTNSTQTSPAYSSCEDQKPASKPRIKIKVKNVSFRLPDFGAAPPKTASTLRTPSRNSSPTSTFPSSASTAVLNDLHRGQVSNREKPGINKHEKLALNPGKIIDGKVANHSPTFVGAPSVTSADGFVQSSGGIAWLDSTNPRLHSSSSSSSSSSFAVGGGHVHRRTSQAATTVDRRAPPAVPLESSTSCASIIMPQKPFSHWVKPNYSGATPLFTPLRRSKKQHAVGTQLQHHPLSGAHSSNTAKMLTSMSLAATEQRVSPVTQSQPPLPVHQQYMQARRRKKAAKNGPTPPATVEHALPPPTTKSSMGNPSPRRN